MKSPSAILLRLAARLVLASLPAALPAAPDPATVAADIRAAATAPNRSPAGRPLPLLGSWNTGTVRGGYDPDYQLRLIQQGHRLLPWFQLELPDGGASRGLPSAYYQSALQTCARLNLPITLVASQWERLLSDEPGFLRLPPALNPNLVRNDGGVVPLVSPFGPLEPWTEAGRRWGGSGQLRRMEALFPRPPRVVFLSNNEHRKLAWKDAASDRRFAAGAARGEGDAVRRTVGQGWIERYRALQRGFAGALEPAWRDAAIFVGYNAFGGPAFGRWPGWIEGSLAVPGRIEPWPLAFDGASAPYYLNDWEQATDHTVWSPQIEAMNQVFMLEEAYRLNPDFWFELSIWDGYLPGQPGNKRAALARGGHPFTPERYGAMARFGLWLLRPRVLREFRGYTQTVAETEPYFLALAGAVDEVHDHPVLGAFWREGRLVRNSSHSHPYQTGIPAEYRERDRWFLLDTDADPPRPWSLTTELPVFALALVKGQAPRREWLIYAHAPLGRSGPVRLRVPERGEFAIVPDPRGRFYRLREQGAAEPLAAGAAP